MVKRKATCESKTNWFQCDQCDQWREVTVNCSEDNHFLCHFMFPWEEQDANGRYAGGCNTESDQFDAFDVSYLDEELSVESIRSCTQHLLDKLPKNFSPVSKADIVDKLNQCVNDHDLMEQVATISGLPVILCPLIYHLLSIRSFQFFTCALADERACTCSISIPQKPLMPNRHSYEHKKLFFTRLQTCAVI